MPRLYNPTLKKRFMVPSRSSTSPGERAPSPGILWPIPRRTDTPRESSTPAPWSRLYTTKTGVPFERFDPVAYTVYIPAGVVVQAESPWKTFKEFIDYAKANPGKVQMANSGHAAMYHIGIVGIEMAMGVEVHPCSLQGNGALHHGPSWEGTWTGP